MSRWESGSQIIGFAHRGAPRTRREHNTLAAFERALNLGARGLETDIGLTLDGAPVLLHPRLLTRRGVDVSRLRRSELPPAIPTLASLYERCGVDFDLSLDMGQPRAAEAVVEIAKRHGAFPRLWLTYWHLPMLTQWRAFWPQVRLVYPTIPVGHRRGTEAMNRLSAIGVDAINVYHAFSTRRLIDAGHTRGLHVFAWGLRRRRSIERAVANGIDGMYCDDVEAMVKAIGLDSRVPLS